MRMGRLLAVGVLALGATAASAGLVQPAPVVVTANADGSGSARGDMITARSSANDVEYIGCGVRKFETGAGVVTSAFCQARDAAGVAGFCTTDNAELTQALQSIAHNSFVTFNWNADGRCTLIGVSTQSFYIP